MKASTHYSIGSDLIEKLQADIERLQASQKMMRDANTALRKGDDGALRAMGFSEEHIADLKKRNFAGLVAFPNYAFRNNNCNIRCLKKRMEELMGEQIGEIVRLEHVVRVDRGAAL